MIYKTNRREFLRQSALAVTACAGTAPFLYGQTKSLRTVDEVKHANIQKFTGQVQGAVFHPGQPGFSSACQLWTGSMPKQPGLVVLCAGTEDIATTIKFACDQGLQLAVRGGGHTLNATCEGGVLINLSAMQGIEVDPTKRMARVQAGVLAGSLDQATAPFDMAALLGKCPTVGVSGLTLGGGLSRLMGQYGALCDTLLGAELVTADGSVVQVDAQTQKDLFWAIRGGSGNFGVVTSFTYQLVPVQQALVGMLRYPISQLRSVLEFFGPFMESAPDTLDALVEIGSGILQYAPDAQEPTMVINVCCDGDPIQAEKTLRPLRRFGNPTMDTIKPMSYFQAQELGDVTGLLNHIRGRYKGSRRSGFVKQLRDEVIDRIVSHCESPSFPGWSVALDHYMHGEVCRKPGDSCAFSLRESGFNYRVAAFQEETGPPDAAKTWVRSLTDALEPYSNGRIYLNYITDQGDAGVRKAFGTNYPRLVELKKKYDPDNVFHLNPNIKPLK